MFLKPFLISLLSVMNISRTDRNVTPNLRIKVEVRVNDTVRLWFD